MSKAFDHGRDANCARTPNPIWRCLTNVERGRELWPAARRLKPFLPVVLDYLKLKGANYPLEARLPKGVAVRLEESEEIAMVWHIFVRECYRVTGSEAVILDLGANIGLFTLHAATQAPRAKIFSVEPAAAPFERLQRHVGLNGLEMRVRALNYAVASSDGARHMADEKVPLGQRRLLTDRATDGAAPGPKVLCRTLASTLDDCGADMIDLVKVDIEGSEFEMFLSTPPRLLKRIRRVALELHNNVTARGYTREALFRHLRRGGLTPVHIETDREGFSQVELAQEEAAQPLRRWRQGHAA